MSLHRFGPRRALIVSACVGLAVLAGCGAPLSRGDQAPTGPAPASSSALPSNPPPGSVDAGALEEAGLPTLPPEAVIERVPTRVVVRDLGIDLPIVAPPRVSSGRFPWCNVAEFLATLSRPGRPGPTFVYAHAREDMFLPILLESRIRGGRAMLGMRVEVFTSDDRRFTYQVAQVLRHVESLDFAYRETAEELILQTSEGPSGTVGKTMLVAQPAGDVRASSADAHPVANPVACR